MRPPREFYVGIAIGLLINDWWIGREIRAAVDAAERGDFDEAERHLRRIYFARLDLLLRRPPDPEPDEE